MPCKNTTINNSKRKPRAYRAGRSFLQFLNRLFQIQITAGDIIQLGSGNARKYYMLSVTCHALSNLQHGMR
jgi:hypothetical protein